MDTLKVNLIKDEVSHKEKFTLLIDNIAEEGIFFVGVITCLLSMFQMQCSYIIIILVGLSGIILVNLSRRYKYIYTCVITLLLGICFFMLLIGQKSVVNGMILSVNQFLKVIGEHTGILQSQYQTMQSDNSLFYTTLFLSLFALLLAGLSTFKIRLILIIPIIFIQVRFGIYPDVSGGFFIIFGSLIVISNRLKNKHYIFGRSKYRVALIVKSFISVVLVIVIVFIYVVFPVKSFHKLDIASKAASDITYMTDQLRYEKNRTNNYTEGNLSKLEDLERTQTTALAVTMNQPTSLYLRGFIGSQYTKDRWTDLDNKTYHDASDLFYWLHKLEFYGLNQLSQVYRLGKDEVNEPVTVNVENINANSKYIYIPYELHSKLNDFSHVRSYDDSSLISTKLFGSRTYSYKSDENLVGRYTRVASNYYDVQDKKSVKKYVLDESHYNAYVYDNYTKLPQETKELFSEELGELPDYYFHMPYEEAQKLIINYLKEHLIYSEKINAKPKDVDFVYYLLKTSKKGYDSHYATVATLMFRYVGIPARYVEGYLVTPDDVKNAESNQSIEIKGVNAHAWVEIYQDGIGWIPIEVTPAYADVMKMDDSTVAPHDKKNEDNEEENDTKVKDRQYKPVNSEEDETVFNYINILIWIVIFLLLLFMIVFISFVINKRNKVKKRKYYFKNSGNKQAINGMFTHLMAVLHYDGIEKIGGSIYNYKLILEDKYSQNYAKKFVKVLDIYQEAVYSRHDITNEDRNKVEQFMEQTLSIVLLSKKFWQRLWMKYWTGLY